MAPDAGAEMNALFTELSQRPEALTGADVAYTPDECAAAIVRYLAREHGLDGVVWEPCAGGGAFVRALERASVPVVATELDPVAAASCGAFVWDALRGLPGAESKPRAIVTNPPFSIAGDLLRVFMAIESVETIAMLLLRNWDAPEERAWIWREALPVESVLLMPRIAFEGPGRNGRDTDTRDYALFVWRRRPGWTWQPRHREWVRSRRLNWKTGEVLG